MSGSVQASDRLMKELREIYRSQSYKTGRTFRPMVPPQLARVHAHVRGGAGGQLMQSRSGSVVRSCAVGCFSAAGIYSVELVNDSLYEWHVKLRT